MMSHKSQAKGVMVALAFVAPLLIPSAVQSAQYFLQGAANKTAVRNVVPAYTHWSSENKCPCCVCWEIAMGNILAYWDDWGTAAGGPWELLLPNSDGADIDMQPYNVGYREATQKLFEFSGLDCDEGGMAFWFWDDVKFATQQYVNGLLGYGFTVDYDMEPSFQTIKNEIGNNRPLWLRYTADGSSHAVMVVGYDDVAESLFYYDTNFPNSTQEQTHSWFFWHAMAVIKIIPSGTDCGSGSCCSAVGNLLGDDYVCHGQAPETKYTCEWDTYCGADVTVQYAARFCNGMDSGCNGELGPWSAPQLADSCTGTEQCVPGQTQCQATADCQGGNPGGVPPAIHMTSTYDQPAYAEADVSWTDSDPDSNAVIMLYYKKASSFPGGVPNEDQPNFAGALPLDTGAIYENADGPFGHYTINLSDEPQLAGQSIYVYAIISDGVNEVYSSNAAFTGKISFAQTANALDIADVEWLEANPSDGDGILEGGEGCELVVTVENDAQQEAMYIKGMLSSPNGQVTIQDGNVAFGSLQPGDSSSGMGDEFDFVTQFVSQDNVEFNITFQYELDGLPYVQHEQLEYDFPADGELGPAFAFDHVVFDDANGNPNFGDGDGKLESGEGGIRYYVYLKNTGNADATEVVAYIQDVAELTLGDKKEQYPLLTAGGPAKPPADGDYFYLNSIPKNFSGTVSTDILVTYGESDIESWVYAVPLFQVAPAPWMYVSPAESGFGVAAPGQVVQKVVQIKNAGTAPFTVDSIQTSHPDTVVDGPDLPFVVPAADMVAVTVQIDTTGLQGAIERSVEVVSADARLDDPEDTTAVISGLVSGTTPDEQLTTLPGSEQYPDVDGGVIVWHDNRNGNWDIYAYILETGEEVAVCTAPGDQRWPRVGDGYVAWSDNRDGDSDYDIYAYSLETGDEILVSGASGNEYLLGVDEGLVAYRRVTGTVYDSEQYGGDPHDVYNAFVHNVVSGQTTQVTNYNAPSGGETYTVGRGDMEDGLLAFRRSRHYKTTYGYWNTSSDGVMKSQPPTSAPVKISDYTGGDVSAAAGKIVWGDEDAKSALDDTQVFMWSNGVLTQVTNEETDHDDAVIGGNLIVYEKSNPPGLYYWNLDKGMESVATLMAGATDYRIDGNLLVWRAGDNIYYKFLEQGDLAITSGDIELSNTQPEEGELLQVVATAHNTGSADVQGPITIELLEEVGNEMVGLAPAVVWPGSLLPGGEAEAAFEVTFASSGQRTLAVRVVAEGDSPGNNTALRKITVVDDDTDAPEILAVSVVEHEGDGDGFIENDEAVLLQWSAADPSGIGSATVVVDGLGIPADDLHSVVFGPLSGGTHVYSVTVEDGDNSPESSESWSGTFEVYVAHPSVVSVQPPDGAVGVALDTGISATLDVDIDVTSLSDTSLTVQDSLGQPVAGTAAFNASNKTLQFIPTELLSNGLQYVAAVDGITDLKGDGLVAPYSWSFSTAADNQPPIAIISSPGTGDVVKGAVEVAGSAFDYNFDSYQLLLASAEQPDLWTSIGEVGVAPVEGGQLGVWDATGVDGPYLLKLVVSDTAGNESDYVVSVMADNTAPVLSQWSLTPADLVEHDVGGLVVQVHVEDQTSGVSPLGVAIAYHLDADPMGEYMQMTHLGDGFWTYEITELVWETLGGSTLGYVVRAEDVAGNVTISDEQTELIDEQNDPPAVDDLPEVEISENSLQEKVIDLMLYSFDEETSVDDLIFAVVEVTEEDVSAWIDDDHYLTVEAAGNWTGTALVTVEVSDGELATEADVSLHVLGDAEPPTPDPTVWDQVPTVGLDPLSAVMSAAASSDDSGVEYMFEELSGNSGGTSSGWQESNEYVDEGLSPGFVYSYRVKSRDLSSALNETAWSTEETVEIGGECGDGVCAEDEDCGVCPVDCPCPDDEVCHEGSCCLPECGDKECGDDGCGGSCGECGEDEACTLGQCEPDCIPDCQAKECGDDGCGGSCGACDAGQSCVEGQCLLEGVEPFADIVTGDLSSPDVVLEEVVPDVDGDVLAPDTGMPGQDSGKTDSPVPGVDSFISYDGYAVDEGEGSTGGGSRSGGCSSYGSSGPRVGWGGLLLLIGLGFLMLLRSAARREGSVLQPWR